MVYVDVPVTVWAATVTVSPGWSVTESSNTYSKELAWDTGIERRTWSLDVKDTVSAEPAAGLYTDVQLVAAHEEKLGVAERVPFLMRKNVTGVASSCAPPKFRMLTMDWFARPP